MRTTRGARIRRLLVLTPEAGGFYMGDLLAGMDDACQAAGAQMLVVQTSVSWQASIAEHTPISDLLRLASRHADGIVAVTATMDAVQLSMLNRVDKPLVAVAGSHPRPDGVRILVDNAGGAAEVVRHLVHHGHRRIAFVGTFAQHDVVERYEGYLTALRECGIDPDPALCFSVADHLAAGGTAAVREMLSAGLPLTAVFASTDTHAIAVMTALREAGVRVPQDVAVIGFDDADAAQVAVPALTTVRQRPSSIGSAAARVLLDQISGRDAASGPVVLPTTLIPRHSCGCGEMRIDEPALVDWGARDWQDQLGEALVRTLVAPLTPDPGLPIGAIWPGVDTIVRALDDALSDRPGPSLAELDEVWSAAGSRTRNAETLLGLVDLLELAAVSRSAAIGTMSSSASLRRASVRAFLSHARAQIIRVSAIVDQLRDPQSPTLLRQISRTFLEKSHGGAAQLEWLGLMGGLQGCVGVAADPAERGAQMPRSLRVAATFGGPAPEREFDGQVVTAEEFPPREWLDNAIEDGAPATVMLTPLVTVGRQWGVLASVLPRETRYFDGYWAMQHAATQLTLALEREELLRIRDQERQRVIETQRHFRALVEHSTDLVLVVDPAGVIRYASPSHEAVLGFAPGDMQGRPVTDWLGRADATRVQTVLRAVAVDDASFDVGEVTVRHADGSLRVFQVRATARLADPAIAGIILNGHDITDRKRMEEALAEQARTDALTGLVNRRVFAERVGLAGEKPHDGETWALLLLDLDGFKSVNDTYGHHVGDQVLCEVAARLKSVTRSTDTVARLGGDEFAVVAECDDRAGATALADRVLAAFAAPLDIEGTATRIGASIGLALYPSDGVDGDTLMRKADAAMYRVKDRRAPGSGHRHHRTQVA